MSILEVHLLQIVLFIYFDISNLILFFFQISNL